MPVVSVAKQTSPSCGAQMSAKIESWAGANTEAERLRSELRDEPWRLMPSPALSPLALAQAIGALSAVSLSVASAFWIAGAPWVLPFACLEVSALILAFVVHARSTGLGEEIWLEGDELVLRTLRAGSADERRFLLRELTLRQKAEARGLIEIVARHERVIVGRSMPPAGRPAVFRSLNAAVQAARSNWHESAKAALK
jgi:uncharacterized membrane protein